MSSASLGDSTSESAQRLSMESLSAGNLEKTMAAPVTVIVAMDMAFHEHLPKLFPHVDARSWFAGNDKVIADTAFRNATLQGGYLIMAARALGLDTGAMSGFDAAKVDAAFFAGTTVKANFPTVTGARRKSGQATGGPFCAGGAHDGARSRITRPL